MAKNVNVVGARYSPTPQQIARVQAFLRTAPVKKLPETVVIVPADKFASVSKTLVGHGDTNWAFSLPQTGRIYLNAAAFNHKHPNSHYSGTEFPEFLLGHELAHLNNPMPSDEQEAQEMEQTKEGLSNEFDDQSRNYLKQWQQNKGNIYSALQQQVAADAGQFQPTPAPLQTQLISPDASTIPLHVAGDATNTVQLDSSHLPRVNRIK